MKRIFCLCLLTTVFSLAAFADIRLPDKPTPTPSPREAKAAETNMRIQFDPQASEARLIIPKSQLNELRAALDQNGGSDEAALGATRTQTIVGGLFLSLAVVFGGVWLARSRGTNRKMNKPTAAVAASLALVCSAGSLVYANIGPPPQLRTISSELFDKKIFRGWKRASGKVRLEISETGSQIELIVPEKAETRTED